MALTIEECRKILGNQQYTDKQIENLRDILTTIATKAFQEAIKRPEE